MILGNRRNHGFQRLPSAISAPRRPRAAGSSASKSTSASGPMARGNGRKILVGQWPRHHMTTCMHAALHARLHARTYACIRAYVHPCHMQCIYIHIYVCVRMYWLCKDTPIHTCLLQRALESWLVGRFLLEKPFELGLMLFVGIEWSRALDL